MIFNRALDLFNQKGIEYIGIRELALDLDLHVGNITYYFPRKENLVEEMGLRLRVANEKTFNAFADSALTLFDFLDRSRQVFQNQYQYRCLLLSVVQLFRNYPMFYREYKATEATRKKSLANAFVILRRSGYLKATLSAEATDELVSLFSFISRFWPSEASVSYRKEKPEWIIAHYLSLLAKILEPHSTSKGKKELQQFLSALKSDMLGGK